MRDEYGEPPPTGAKTEVISAVVGTHGRSSSASITWVLKPISMSLGPFTRRAGPPSRGACRE